MSDELGRRFLRLSAINIASNLTVPLAGLVDTAMLGHLPDIRFLAGAALAALVFDYLYWSLGFLRMATTGTTAQAAGRGDAVELQLSLLRPVSLALVIGAVLVLFRHHCGDLAFFLLSGEPGVEAAGRDYFDARIWGAPAALGNLALVGWFLGKEQSGHALAVTAVANLANVALDYLFILRLDMAATGAGLATVLSQYLMLGVGLAIVLWEVRRTRLSVAGFFDSDRIGQLFRLNANILIRTVCLVSAFALFTNWSAVLGTLTLAANSVLLRLLSVASYWIDGTAFATESLAGVLVGAENRFGLRRLLILSLIVGELFAALFLLPIIISPASIAALLTSHQEVIDITIQYSVWLVPTLLLGSIAYTLDGFFIGLTAGDLLRRAMLWSTVPVFLPLALAGYWLRSPHLLWSSMAGLMLARAATLGYAAWPYLFPGSTSRESLPAAL